MWDEITYLFPNFNAAIAKFWEWMSNFTQYFIMNVIVYAYLDYI